MTEAEDLLIISGGVTSMVPFLEKFFPQVYAKMKQDSNTSNYCKFNSQLLTAFTSSLQIAGLAASLFASSVTRAFGRRISILIAGVSFLAGGALSGAADNIYVLILGRVLLGIGVGFGNQAVPLYLSEMAPTKWRGTINCSFQLSVAIGVLSATLVNYGTEKIKGGWGWRVSLAMAAAPATILTIGAIFLPETPNSLIQHSNNQKKAKLTLQRIRGTEDVEAEFDDLIEASNRGKNIKHPFRTILRRKYRPQLIMSIAMPFFQQMTGVNIIAFFAPVLFITIGFSESVSLLATVILSVIGTAATVIAMILIDKLGRRILLIIGGIQMFITHIIIGVVMSATLGDHGGIDKGYGYFIITCIIIYIVGFAFSWGPLGWLIPSEIFPLEIRSAGQSINVAVNFLCTFLVAQTFLAMLCYFKTGAFFFFGGWVMVMTIFVYFLLPETKNIPIEQMEKVWMGHWFWKKIIAETNEDSKMEA